MFLPCFHNTFSMCTWRSLRSSVNHSSREQLSAFALKILKTTALCGYGFHDRETYDTVIMFVKYNTKDLERTHYHG